MKKNNPYTDNKEDSFALPRKNVFLLIIGLGIVALGFILLSGGRSADPDVFNSQALFSFRRMVLSPILICGGFIFEVIAIMRVIKK